MTRRESNIRNQVISLFYHGKIVTTLEKAKETRRYAEKMIRLAKRNDVHSRREVQRMLGNRKILKRLFNNIAPQFKEKNSGYSRIIKIHQRRGDGANMAILQLFLSPQEEKPEKK